MALKSVFLYFIIAKLNPVSMIKEIENHVLCCLHTSPTNGYLENISKNVRLVLKTGVNAAYNNINIHD